LGRLKRLRYLNITENAFENLPECVCGMQGLIELRASNNPLATLPDSVQQLTALRELHLRNTKVEYLPDAIAGLLQLRQIDLRWVDTLEPSVWFADLEARGCVVYR